MNDVNEFNKYIEFRRNFIYVSDLKIKVLQERVERIIREHPDYKSDSQYKKIVDESIVEIRNIGYRKEIAEKELTNDAFYSSMVNELLFNKEAQSVERKSRLF